MNFKSNMLQYAQNLKESVKRFPCAAVHSCIMFILHIILLFLVWINLESDIHSYYSALQLIPGLLLAVCAVLLCEKYNLHGKLYTALKWAVPLIVSAVIVLLYQFTEEFFISFGITNYWRYTDYITIGIIGISVFVVCACIFLLYTEQNKTLLFMHIIKTFLLSVCVSLIFMLGIMLCMLAVELLFGLGTNYNTFYLYMTIFNFSWQVVGVFLLLAGVPKKDEVLKDNDIFNVLLGYVALPIYMLLLLILNFYCLRILFAWELPSGTVNWFASFALLFLVFFSLSLPAHKNKFARLAVKICSFALIPIIIVQLICIWVRYDAYGLTTMRWLSLAFIAVGVVGLVIFLLNKQHKWLFAVGGIVALLVTLTPLNVLDFPQFEQSVRLKSVLARNGLITQSGDIVEDMGEVPEIAYDELEIIASTYEYLRYESDAVPSKFALQIADSTLFDHLGIEDLDIYDSDLSTYEYINIKLPYGFDVAGYSKVYMADYTGLSDGGIIKVYPEGESTEEDAIVFDVTDELLSMYDEYVREDSEDDLEYEFILDDGTKLLVDNVQFEIFESGKIEVASLDWVIMIK